MFDPKKPNNNLKKLPLNFNFEDIDILKQLNKTNIAITRLNWVTKEIPNRMLLVDFLSVKESVNSNQIENIHTTVTEVFKSELKESKEKIKYQDKEALHYRQALKFWIREITKTWWLGFNTIVKLNDIIIQKEVWIYSSPDKKIEKEYPNGEIEVIYTPPVWIELITELLYNLEAYYNDFDEAKEIDPLLKLPIIHYQFEAIHPFSDGNWRVWRILIVLYLFLYKKLDVPVLYISDYIMRYKDEYTDFLNKIDAWKEGEFKKFIIWLLKWIEIQSFVTELNIQKIKNLRKEIKAKLKEDIEFKKLFSNELMDYLFSRPFYTFESMAKYLGKHRNTTYHYLTLLEKKWLLDSFTMWRKKVFVFVDFLELLDWKVGD